MVVVLLMTRPQGRHQQRRRYERAISARTAQVLGQRIGLQSEFVSTITSGSMSTPRNPHPTSEEVVVDEEAAAARAEAAISELQRVEQARAEAIGERIRAIEEKLPDAGQAQRYALSNELCLLAFELGELSRRIDRIEDKQITRTQVVGIVISTLLAAIAAIAALFAIFKALGLVH